MLQANKKKANKHLPGMSRHYPQFGEAQAERSANCSNFPNLATTVFKDAGKSAMEAKRNEGAFQSFHREKTVMKQKKKKGSLKGSRGSVGHRSCIGASYMLSSNSVVHMVSRCLSKINYFPLKYGLDNNTVDFIGHALALHRDDRYLDEPALDTVKWMKVIDAFELGFMFVDSSALLLMA
ncbi:hypothetical protein REPUB_Repub01dG0000200 [Reevesia pubescens]